MISHLIMFLLTSLAMIASPDTANFPLEKVFDVNDIIAEDVKVSGGSQGFAMYGKYGFFFHDKGQVLIIDLHKKKLISTFVVPGLEKSHCNNAGFSDEKYSRKSVFPLLYVTEVGENNRCFVVDLNFKTGKIVQEIWYDGGDYSQNFDWCIDVERGFIYTRGGNNTYWRYTPDKPKYGKMMMVKKFFMPKKADFTPSGEIHLTLENALDSFVLDDVFVGQGSVIHNGIMYTGEGAPKLCHCRIHVIDLDHHTRVSIYNVSYLHLEPEGFAFRKGWVYVTFNTSGKPRNNVLYRFRI